MDKLGESTATELSKTRQHNHIYSPPATGTLATVKQFELSSREAQQAWACRHMGWANSQAFVAAQANYKPEFDMSTLAKNPVRGATDDGLVREFVG